MNWMIYFILSIVSFLLMILENSIFNDIKILGVAVNYSLIYVVLIAMFLEGKYSIFNGVFLGIIMDLSVNTAIGLNGLVFFIVSYVIYALRDKIFRENTVSLMILMVCSSLFDSILKTLFLQKYIYGTVIVFFIKNFIIYTILNLLIGIVIHKFMKKIFIKNRIGMRI